MMFGGRQRFFQREKGMRERGFIYCLYGVCCLWRLIIVVPGGTIVAGGPQLMVVVGGVVRWWLVAWWMVSIGDG
ncbi:hypothetical protein Hanom_Chr17g01529761 [Helianthus anomalus]